MIEILQLNFEIEDNGSIHSYRYMLNCQCVVNLVLIVFDSKEENIRSHQMHDHHFTRKENRNLNIQIEVHAALCI